MVKRFLANRAMSAKLSYASTGSVHHSVYDRLVFRRVREVLGGRVRLMVTGSAPISPNTINFLKMAFSCPFVEGYGQTETCGASFATSIDDSNPGTTGGPLLHTEYRVESVTEMRYTVDDVDENGNPAPRGEICIRGPQVFKGYYKMPEETAATIDEEGWLHTGDIGVVTSDTRALKLIDRKKNIFKLAQGEYVAIEKVEPAYSECKFVQQIFIYGDSLKSCLVAVVVPDSMYVTGPWAEQNNLSGVSLEELCNNPQLRQDALKDLQQVGRAAGLAGFEIVMNVHLEPVPWTPEDLLTYTHKLKRFDAREKYREILDRLYAELEA